MATASHATPVPAADALDATVIAITADGKLYLGIKPVDISALRGLPPGAVYVKADARVPYQTILTVLDALREHTVVLLTAALSSAGTGQILPPYGIQISIGGH
jgi:biopolymer transport protein ExbD